MKKTSKKAAAKKSARDGSSANFEKDIEALEGIVASLEEGGLSLDDALKKFEQGIQLAQRCESALNTAEKKIETLTKNADGSFATEPFGDDEDKEDEDSDDEDEEDDGEDADEEGELLF